LNSSKSLSPAAPSIAFNPCATTTSEEKEEKKKGETERESQHLGHPYMAVVCPAMH
jgi:hypothetical protein